MAFSLGSLVQTAGQTVDKHRQHEIENAKLQRQRDLDVMQRALLEAQVGKLNREGANQTATAQAYLQQYPELQSFAGSPQEVVARGRQRDNEALIRERPVADYPVVDEHGQVVLVPRPKQQTPLRPIRQQGIGSQQPEGSLAPQAAAPQASTPQAPPQNPAGARTQNPVQSPPSQGIRPASGARGTGIRKFQPGLIVPSQGEQDAANWAPGVIQGFTGFRDSYRKTPRAVAEAVPFLQALDITASAPGIGQVLSGVTRAAAQQGLSPDAQKVVQSFLRWTASRVFATGGKQLTQNEIRTAIGQYMPALGEDSGTSEQRLESMAQDATNVLFATGRSYPRIKQNLTAAGAPDLGDFDPYSQQFTGQVTYRDLLGPVPTPPKPGRYGYTRPQ